MSPHTWLLNSPLNKAIPSGLGWTVMTAVSGQEGNFGSIDCGILGGEGKCYFLKKNMVCF